MSPNHRPILDVMFSPKSVAVIGASETQGRVGRALMENLQSFSGAGLSGESESRERPWKENLPRFEM